MQVLHKVIDTLRGIDDCRLRETFETVCSLPYAKESKSFRSSAADVDVQTGSLAPVIADELVLKVDIQGWKLIVKRVHGRLFDGIVGTHDQHLGCARVRASTLRGWREISRSRRAQNMKLMEMVR